MNDQDDEVIQMLLDACRGVPYLATCINETIAKAGLKLVKVKDEYIDTDVAFR